jgi:hypothetical protein
LPAPPLTHHDIVALVEPFARRGRHVDLAASRRQDRRLVFKPALREGPTPRCGALQESLRLECPLAGGLYRLTRTVDHPDAGPASLSAYAADLGVLVAAVEAIPVERHFTSTEAAVIARSYGLDAGSGGGESALVLTHATLRVAGLALTLTVPPVRRVAADITLEPDAGERLALPEDLLAVLGWSWARLVRRGDGWTTKLRLRGTLAQRTQRAEAAVDRLAVHLARTLAEPPARYHERHHAARWGVFFRRGIPTLTALALVAVVLLSAPFRDEVPTQWLVALYHVPTLFVALSFVLQELPRFEIPPWPRRSTAPEWRLESEGTARRPV